MLRSLRTRLLLPCWPSWSPWGCGGAGLGLAIAREIVAAHGGEIDVASQPGTGNHLQDADRVGAN